jgi:rubrerythrin
MENRAEFFGEFRGSSLFVLHSAARTVACLAAAPLPWRARHPPPPPLAGGLGSTLVRLRRASLACSPPHAGKAGPGNNFAVWCEEHRNDGDEEDLGKRLRGEYVDPDRKATAVTYRSAFKALWKCRECGYEWRARIYNRTGKNPRGCPSCSNRLPLSPTNNFAARCKENGARGARLLKEYDDPVTKPTEVAFASNKKVRWKCSKCKHKWEAVLSNRTNSDNPTGCPSCAG